MTEATASWVGGVRSFVLISLCLSHSQRHHAPCTKYRTTKSKRIAKTKLKERLVCKAFPRILPQLIKFSRMAQADNDSFNASRCVNWAQLFIAEFGCFSYHSHTQTHARALTLVLIFIFVHIHIQLVGPSLGSPFDSLQGHKIVTIWPHWPRIPSSYQHIA